MHAVLIQLFQSKQTLNTVKSYKRCKLDLWFPFSNYLGFELSSDFSTIQFVNYFAKKNSGKPDTQTVNK